MATWRLQQAKARFSEVVRAALADGVQVITLHGQPSVVVLSEREYRTLAARGREPLTAFLARSPFTDEDLADVRLADVGRDVEV